MAVFAGVGGIEKGLKTAGHETVLFCENEPAAAAVLERRFPGVTVHPDVTQLDALPRGTELLTAGFPCQDLSQAGQTKGIRGSKSGLVGFVFDLLRTHEVPFVLLENVPFMLQLSKGRAMDVLVERLERLGYRWAYRVVDARAFGVPQRRERVFLLACLDADPREVLLADEVEPDEPKGTVGEVACGFYWTEGNRGLGWAVDAVPTLKGGSGLGIPSPPAILMPDGRLVTPDVRDAERLQGFPMDWTKPAEKTARKSTRWKLVGNAVAVGVSRWIGRRLVRPGRAVVGEGEPLARRGSWPRVAWNVGDGVFTADASTWPKRYKRPSLATFLKREPKPLSFRAASGFYERIRVSSLRTDDGFLDAVRDYVQAFGDGVAASRAGPRRAISAAS